MFAAFRNQSGLLFMAKSKQSSLQTTVLTDNLRIDSVYDFSNRLACVAAGPRLCCSRPTQSSKPF